MGTHGYFFIGTGELKEFLGYMSMDGYPWQGKGYKLVLASRTEEEFRHLATNLGLWPANVGVNYSKMALNNFEYSYCWEEDRVKLFTNGEAYRDNGELEKWREKIRKINEKATVAKNATIQSDHPSARIIEEILKILDADMDHDDTCTAIRSFCAGANAFLRKSNPPV